MAMKSTRLLIVLSLAAVMLAGCGDVRENLGLGRDVPDEFAVVDRPPLSMPPDFTLRPPAPGAPRPQAVNTSQSASNLLFGVKSDALPQKDAQDSSVEKALLEKADVAAALPNIRAIVDREDANQVVGNEHLIDALLWWKKTPSQAVTVNAAAEAARIKEAKDKGQPLNKGATPIIERQKTGWLSF
jgi:predicted small secreted protein